eukprot:Tbor_TRINITY_DN3351_c0_g1::TRINITY_DN3351_c0_g1_i1::g.23548::m.23548
MNPSVKSYANIAPSQQILLDSSIRDWVLLPIILITLLVGLLRYYVTILLKPCPNPKLKNARSISIAAYSRKLLEDGYHLSPDGYKQRVEMYCGKIHSNNHGDSQSREVSKKQESNNTGGLLNEKQEVTNPMEAMSDPSVMTDMLKNNFIYMIPNVGMMSLVSYFFSGFVTAKVPFNLSSRFRGMMQNGVDIDDLDVSYVTSLSMYFMIMFGTQGVLSLIIGSNAEASLDPMAQQQQMMGGQQPGQPVDYGKLFKQLKEELEFSFDQYKWKLADAPCALIAATREEN